jgi:predicted DNA-binding transcriptional regulator YafY
LEGMCDWLKLRLPDERSCNLIVGDKWLVVSKMQKSGELKFKYKNWEGKMAVRSVKPIKFWFGETRWHPQKQWFLKAYDLEKKAERDFAARDIIKFL